MLTRAQRDNWAKWLRQPNLHQARRRLARPLYKDSPIYAFCCLGVYCHFDEKIRLDLKNADSMGYELPEEINPAGESFHYALREYTFRLDGHKPGQKPESDPDPLINGLNGFTIMNDELEWSFARIANVVENLPVKD